MVCFPGHTRTGSSGAWTADRRTLDALTTEASPLGDGPDAAPVQRWRVVDVDGDCDLDLLLQFRTLRTGISRFDTAACLTGGVIGGEPFQACDVVQLVMG